jgi:hypothetical protein
MSELKVVVAKIPEFNKSDNTLSDGMNINRLSAIVVVPNHPIVFEEMLSIKRESCKHTLIEVVAPSNCTKTPECKQIESGMKVVNPAL